MPRTLEQAAVFAAPAVFVLLWSSGFIGAKFGLAYAEPLTYLALRMLGVIVILGIIVALTPPLGGYMTRLFSGERTFLSPILRPDAQTENAATGLISQCR